MPSPFLGTKNITKETKKTNQAGVVGRKLGSSFFFVHPFFWSEMQLLSPVSPGEPLARVEP